MRYLLKLILFCLLTVIVLATCTVSKTICPCEAPEIIRLGDKEIEINAKVTIIDSVTISKMKVLIWLTTLDSTSLPTNFVADYYYIRSSNLSRNAYEGKFTRIHTDSIKGIMELEATNAPRWELGEFVDVAVHLVDSRGKVYFLKKGDLPIQTANQ